MTTEQPQTTETPASASPERGTTYQTIQEARTEASAAVTAD